MIENIPTEFEVLDDRFRTCRGDPRVERLYGDCRWAEGPVYVPGGRYLVWSDIPNDRMLRWDETTGRVGVFRQPAGYSNGNTLDAQGRLVTCEHGNRRVSRTEHDGSISTIADRFDGKRLNSPNDVVVRSDGSIWFTDPAYGIDSDYEGHRAESEIGSCNVYRVDAISGECRIVADDFARPNGLAFSPDETALYVTDSEVGHMRVFARHRGRRPRRRPRLRRVLGRGVRRDPARHRGPGLGGRGRRRPLLRPRRDAARQAPPSRAGVEPRLRRARSGTGSSSRRRRRSTRCC